MKDISPDGRGRNSFIHELICRFEEEVGAIALDTVIEEAVYTLIVDGCFFREIACSPWDLPELVVGNLFTSHLIDRADEVAALDIDEKSGIIAIKTVKAPSEPNSSANGSQDRSGDAVGQVSVEPMLTAQEVTSRINFLEGNSWLFHRTGGVHSAVMVNDSGELVAWFEDIGRHNALDKLAGWCAMNQVDASDKVLLFSGRVPREIIVRAIRIGFPVVISPGAPTSLSVKLACEHGVTLIGFAKNGTFNVYTHSARIR